MGLMYEAITELMDACVKELKRSNNKLDTTDLTVDQASQIIWLGRGRCKGPPCLCTRTLGRCLRPARGRLWGLRQPSHPPWHILFCFV